MMPIGYVPSDQIFKHHQREDYQYYRATNAEYAARQERIRTFMSAHELDCLLIAGGTGTWDRNWNNTRWAVNHVGCQLTNASYVVFPRQENPTVLAFPLNALLPARRAREIVEDVRSAPQADVATVERINELGLDKGRIGVVETDLNSSIPMRHWQTFQQSLPDTTFEFITRQWWQEVRLVRSAEEITLLERAARIGDAMSLAVAEHLTAGMPEREAYACMSEAMIRGGGEIPSMVLAASGPTSTSWDTVQRERPLNRILEHGDMLLTEVAPRWPDGSECQTGRTYFFGPPTDRYRRMSDVMLEAYEAVVASLRPGNTDQDVLAAGKVITDAGYVWASPLIHGAEGGASGSLPMVAPPVAVQEVEPFTFQPNIVVCVEIHVAEPDHTGGVFLADTWVTTEGDPRGLNHFPREPLIL